MVEGVPLFWTVLGEEAVSQGVVADHILHLDTRTALIIDETLAPRSPADTDQQPVGCVDGDAAGEGVMDGQAGDGGRGVVASSLIYVAVHVEVDRIVSQRLLPHVLQLHPRHVHGPEAALHLKTTAATRDSGLGACGAVTVPTYLHVSTERVEAEELAGLVAVAAGLHLATEQDVTRQQAHLRPDIHTIHLLPHVDKLGFTWTHTVPLEVTHSSQTTTPAAGRTEPEKVLIMGRQGRATKKLSLAKLPPPTTPLPLGR